MSATFTTIYVVMRNGTPMGAYSERAEAFAHSRAIGGPGEGHAIGVITLELVHGKVKVSHGTEPHVGQEDQPAGRGDRPA